MLDEVPLRARFWIYALGLLSFGLFGVVALGYWLSKASCERRVYGPFRAQKVEGAVASPACRELEAKAKVGEAVIMELAR